MADYVSSLTGVAMDAALMDMAEHNSEAWAVGERNGIPVGSDDVTYQNNAQYYAQQAQSIAPASVTEAVRWDIAQTALTDANKAQARSNIDAGKNGAWSNRNLLDNAYFVGGGSQLGDGVFPINQRGTTSYSLAYGMVFDRWHLQGSSSATVALGASGLTFTADVENCGLSQTIPQGRIESGKIYTLSVMTTDGVVHSASRVLTCNDTWQNFALGLSSVGFYTPCYVAANGQTNVYIADRTGSGGSASIGIAAAKLEKGTVSTLANDPPPDFGEELRKCQRYLWVENIGANTPIASGVAFNTSSVLDFITPVPMRSGATIQITFNITPYITYGTGNLALAGGSSSVTSGKNGNHLRVQIGHQNNYDLGNLTEVHLLCGQDTTMAVSAEL